MKWLNAPPRPPNINVETLHMERAAAARKSFYFAPLNVRRFGVNIDGGGTRGVVTMT